MNECWPVYKILCWWALLCGLCLFIQMRRHAGRYRFWTCFIGYWPFDEYLHGRAFTTVAHGPVWPIAMNALIDQHLYLCQQSHRTTRFCTILWDPFLWKQFFCIHILVFAFCTLLQMYCSFVGMVKQNLTVWPHFDSTFYVCAWCIFEPSNLPFSVCQRIRRRAPKPSARTWICITSLASIALNPSLSSSLLELYSVRHSSLSQFWFLTRVHRGLTLVGCQLALPYRNWLVVRRPKWEHKFSQCPDLTPYLLERPISVSVTLPGSFATVNLPCGYFTRVLRLLKGWFTQK